jgi:uncharacterized protein YkwD
MAATPTGRGYWLVAADGGIFSFGNARFRGSGATRSHSAPIAGIAATPSGSGYWLVGLNGVTLAFGDARAFGTQLAPGASDVVTIAASPRSGYWVAARDGTVGTSTTNLASPTRSSTGPRAIAFELLRRMNAERAARHMPALAWDPLLAGFASSWAQTLLANHQFQHQSLGRIVEAAHGRLAEVGENLYSGTGGAADAGTAHLALMASVEHRENLLLPQGQLVGVGAACSGGMLVVVEDFGITMGANLPPPGQGVAPATPVVASNPDGAHC